MNSHRFLPFLFAFILFGLQSCVTAKKYRGQEALANRFLQQRDDCQEDVKELEHKVEVLEEQNQKLTDSLQGVINDKNTQSALMANCRNQVDALESTNDRLQQELDDLARTAGQREADYLQRLNDKEKALQSKEEALAQRENELRLIQEGLDEANRRANKLERSIEQKDSTVAAIRDKIGRALQGFASDELSIDTRDGKIYVSLSEKLLFGSGKYTIEKDKGMSALQKVAEVVLKQPDVNVVVEGHTDSIPYVSNSGSIRNNWDLSVMRATTVTEILVDDYNVPAERIQAAGKGANNPVADNSTAEGRRKNRRIEIILSPDLTALWEIMDGE